jgi:S-DNA-T family DNA segregation ATPase FtsK/SpoIIIE
LRKSIFLFLFALCIYFFIATLIPSFSYVGKFGEFLGKTNLLLFGYLGYIFPLLLIFLLYAFYKDKFNYDFSLKVLGGVFVFFAFLLMQYEIFKKGVIAKLFAGFLEKYIGVLGIWIFIFLLLAWSGFLIFEEKIMKFFSKPQNVLDNSKELDNLSNKDINNFSDNVEVKVENGLLDEDSEWIEENNEEIEDNKEINEKVKFSEIKDNENHKEAKKISEKKEKILSPEIKELQIEEKVEKTPEKIEKNNIQKVEVLEDTKKLLSQIETGKRNLPANWKFPPIEFLAKPKNEKKIINEAEIDKKIKILIEKLKQFKIEGDVVRYYVGPVVTTFEFKPLPHIKVSKILALQDDLAMALKAQSIRIQAPIPGKDVVGIEIPNEKMQTIYLREILESDIFKKAKSPLTIALGKDIVGEAFVTDLKKLPHLLIAGTTGSGKSVTLQ